MSENGQRSARKRPRIMLPSNAPPTTMIDPSAAYGHFGRELPGVTWETTHRAAALADAVRG